MPRHTELLTEIEQSPEGPQLGAFFDFDGTVIYGYSAVAFIREQVRKGHLSPREFMELAAAMTSFGLGNMGFSALMLATSQFMRGVREESYIEFGEELYKKHIARLVYPESRALINAHLAKGHTVAIISSATPYQVEPAARDLGIDQVMCTRLEVKDGVLTGGVVRPTCFGEGKVRAAEELAATNGVDLDQTWFYSDSDDDLELLERVGKPRPLNPNRKLAAIARREGWPIRRFKSRGRPGVTDWARSIAATGSLVTSFAAGLPIWAITGSRRSAQNFSFSLFADTASALIGLDLEVKGEANLWSHRPAVFIFNHQSKADVVIACALVRKDIAGVGKKEIRKMPVLGRVMELGGAVLIDRENASSAIEAMQPLVDAMRIEGKSVLLAPEGTRTVSPRLYPFKKGAFHLAMQAGVPIVPIVIHNALDVAPKGDFIFRPATVEVEVLPPVDTSKWTRATIDQHVAEVRGMYLKALGQDDAEKAGAKAKQKSTSNAASRKSAAGSGSRAGARGKAKASARKTADTGAKTKAKTKVRATSKSTETARAKSDSARAKTKAKATTKTQTKAASRIKAKAKTKAKARTNAKAKTTAKAKAKTGASAKRAGKAATAAKSKTGTKTKTKTKTKTRAKTKAGGRKKPAAKKNVGGKTRARSPAKAASARKSASQAAGAGKSGRASGSTAGRVSVPRLKSRARGKVKPKSVADTGAGK